MAKRVYAPWPPPPRPLSRNEQRYRNIVPRVRKLRAETPAMRAMWDAQIDLLLAWREAIPHAGTDRDLRQRIADGRALAAAKARARAHGRLLDVTYALAERAAKRRRSTEVTR